jgi:hypothetical protein
VKDSVLIIPRGSGVDIRSSGFDGAPRLRLPEGRPYRWPDDGEVKTVKKEKLFERWAIQLLLSIMIIGIH